MLTPPADSASGLRRGVATDEVRAARADAESVEALAALGDREPDDHPSTIRSRRRRDANSSARNLALGLLADTSTRIVYAQESGEAEKTGAAIALSPTEIAQLPDLKRGEGLWRIGERAFVVSHDLTPAELAVYDTNPGCAGGRHDRAAAVAMDHDGRERESNKGENLVKIDLQDLYRANPKAFIAASAVIAAASRPGRQRRRGHPAGPGGPAPHTARRRRPRTKQPPWQRGDDTQPELPPVVPDSSADASAPGEREAVGGLPQAAAGQRSLITPAPAWTRIPTVPPNAPKDQTGYAVAFIEELLDRDYRSQSRQLLVGRKRRPPRSPAGNPGPRCAEDAICRVIDPAAVGR